MLSKLTFSLAFVVLLIFTISFLTTPAMAQGVNPGPNGWVVSEKSENNGIGAGATAVSWSEMPDLADVFRWGGTIELQIDLGNPDGTQTIKVPAGKSATDNADNGVGTLTAAEKKAISDAATHRAVITEVMWGLDLSQPAATQTRAQWIEVYNNGAAFVDADALTIVVTQNTAQHRVGEIVGTSDPKVVVDSVTPIDTSNFVGWTPPGSNGNTGTLEGKAPTYLTSMYRKRDLAGVAYKDKTEFGRGDAAGSWAASAARSNITGYYIGTPGAVHKERVGGTAATYPKVDVAAAKDGTGLIINEFRNDTTTKNVDWVEIHNNSTLPASVKGYKLRLVTATADADATHGYKDYAQPIIVDLPDYEIPAGGYLLLVNQDPQDPLSALAKGTDVAWFNARVMPRAGGTPVVYHIDAKLQFEDHKKFLLVLKSGDSGDSDKQFVDFAGNGLYPNTGTSVWPLRGWGALTGEHFTDGPLNQDLVGVNYAWARKAELKDNGQYRAVSGASRLHKDHWEKVMYKGGIGYQARADQDIAPGTPGYANVIPSYENEVRTGKTNYEFDGKVTISEIMYDAGPRWNQVQWIELYNSSQTQPINIGGWELEIRNKEDVDTYVDSLFVFAANTYIQPNQTLLLVSRIASGTVPDNRVYDLQQHSRELGLLRNVPNLLSRTGFNLKLYARSTSKNGARFDWTVHDEVGNVKVEGAKRPVQWSLTEIKGYDENARQSIVRQYGTRYIDGSTGNGTDDGDGPDDMNEGMAMEGWRYSDIIGAALTYYGHISDVGTPGYRRGGPLPVSLSSFIPKRDKATGQVVITWVTQSELNNAGFNILRSDSRDGEFKVINLQGLIAGQGTTSEKHVYTYTDANAKPNVVYYYQIEDVSLDGKHTTLRTTHLRGNVSAAGKVTTTWGDLKFQK